MTSITVPLVRRRFIDSRWGQLHLRETGQGSLPPLACLHATAYSGRSMLPLLPHLARDRRVLALDTPGYGDSDAPPARPAFAAYAQVLAEALTELADGEPVDLFGYHTGALLATEIALLAPQRVRRLVLIGVPFFEGDEHAAWRERLVHAPPGGERLQDFQPRWDFFVTQRAEGVPLARGIDNFIDELKAHPLQAWAHEALFDASFGERLPRVRQPVLVINPASALAPASSRAAARMPDARVVELPSLSQSIFDLGPALLAETMLPFLAR